MNENNKILDILKNVKFWGVPLLMLIGLISFMIQSTNTVNEAKYKASIISNWYSQLPDTDWMKNQNSIYGSNDPFFTLIPTLMVYSDSLFEQALNGMEQESKFAKIIIKADKVNTNIKKNSYKLYDDNDKKLTKVKLKVGNTVSLTFRNSEQTFIFEITENDYMNNNLGNTFIFSYIEDTEIAKIYNGELEAINKGKTNLILYTQGYVFKYPIIVR